MQVVDFICISIMARNSLIKETNERFKEGLHEMD